MMRRCSCAAAAALLIATMGCAAAARPSLTLGIDGDRFTVDGSPKFLILVSYFDGTRRAAAGGVDADFAYLQGKVHGVRVFPNWWADPCKLRSGTDTLFDLDGHIRPVAWRQLQALLDSAAAHGLVVDLSLTRETVTDNGTPPRALSFIAYAEAIATLVGATDYLKGRYPHLLVDVQNEWPRFSEAAGIEALLGRLRAADPQRILAASSSGGPYQPVGLSLPNVAAAYHDPRERDWFTAGAAARVVSGVKAALGGTVQPVYLQEPTPASAQCPGQQHDGDPSHFVEAMKQARAAGAAAWTFHTRLGFALREQTLLQRLQEPANGPQRTVIEQLMNVSR
jgi:hypothetical protein